MLAIKKAVRRFVDRKEVLPLISYLHFYGVDIHFAKNQCFNNKWSIFEQKWNEMFNNTDPFIKIWCAVLISALVWEKLTSVVGELNKFIQICS